MMGKRNWSRPGGGKEFVAIANRPYENLSKGGVLLIGHSESLAGIQHPFRYVKPAIYQKEK